MVFAKITVLEATCISAAAFGVGAILFLIFNASKRSKYSYKIPLAIGTLSVFSLLFSYLELERLHSLLFMGNYAVKTQADLERLFGAPTSKLTGAHQGRRIIAWVYKIDLISPKLRIQFEFDQDVYVGSVGQIKPPGE